MIYERSRPKVRVWSRGLSGDRSALISLFLQYGPAIPTREHLSFRFPVLGPGGAGRACFSLLQNTYNNFHEYNGRLTCRCGLIEDLETVWYFWSRCLSRAWQTFNLGKRSPLQSNKGHNPRLPDLTPWRLNHITGLLWYMSLICAVLLWISCHIGFGTQRCISRVGIVRIIQRVPSHKRVPRPTDVSG